MKKTTIIILSLALGLSLSACGKKEAPAAVTQDSPSAEQKSLMQWVEGGGSVECVMRAPEGDLVIKTQGDKVRMEGMPAIMPMDTSDPAAGGDQNQIGTTIYNGDWMYSWSGTKGTKMNQKRIQELSEEMGGIDEEEAETSQDWTDTVAEMEDMQVAYECEPKTFAASEFTEPSGVEFTDLTAQFEQMAEMTRNMQESLNNGNLDPNNLPPPPDLPDMDALMQEMEN
jgi:hypothetical protein